jgi:hypothetical protein
MSVAAVEQDVLTRLYEAFNRRDVDTVLTALHPEVDWPNGMEGGRLVGHQAVRAYWKRQFAVIASTVLPVGFVMLDDGRVRVEVDSTVRDLSGAVLD